MALPSCIVIANLTPHDGGAAACAANDFADAYAAYARDMASSMRMNLDEVLPRFSYVECDDVARGERVADDVAMPCAVVTFCTDMDFRDVRLALNDACGLLLPLSCPEVSWYLVSVSSGYQALSTGPGHAAADDCPVCIGVAQAFHLKGILALGGGALYPRFSNAPRMGVVRHRVSESMDALVHAVMGNEHFGRSSANLRIPRLIYRRLSDAAAPCSMAHPARPCN